VNQTLRRLGEYLPRKDANNKNPGSSGVAVARVINAPREAVFRAFTEAERSRGWLSPGEITNSAWQLHLRRAPPDAIPFCGADDPSYLRRGVLNAGAGPERLVFTDVVFDERAKALFEALYTIDFAEHDGKTRLILQVAASAGEAAAPYLARMEQGWNQSLDRLARNAPL